MKHCSKCFEVLPMNKNYFGIGKKNKDGFQYSCKRCSRDENKKHYKENTEKYKTRIKKYQTNNQKSIADSKRKYYKKNKKRHSNLMAEWHSKNKDKQRTYSKNYRLRNKEKIKQINREWYRNNKHKRAQYYKKNKDYILKRTAKRRKDNPLISRVHSHKYRQKKKLLKSNFTIDQWRECLTHFNHQCAYCDCTEKLEQEHVIPVSKGGHYTADNIIPACRSCNASKNNKSLEEWYINHQSYSTLRMDFIKDYLESNSLPILKEA